jgi:hypothetical protein
MQTPLLTKAELDRVLAPTSPHSFKHNVSLLCAHTGVQASSEPLSSIPDIQVFLTKLSEVNAMIYTLKRDLSTFKEQGLPIESMLLGAAMILGAAAIEIRTLAAAFGLPLEEVQEALIGTILTASTDGISPGEAGTLSMAAVNTVIYGVRKARHPYENIQDE